jgi:hypothetical protein
MQARGCRRWKWMVGDGPRCRCLDDACGWPVLADLVQGLDVDARGGARAERMRPVVWRGVSVGLRNRPKWWR